MSSFSPKLPEWASFVRVQANVFVPYPPSSQQVGVLPEAVSRDGFWRRFALELATVTVTAPDSVELPPVSTARARTVWLPFIAMREFQLKAYGLPIEAVPTTAPSTRKSTWSTARLSAAFADSVTLPATTA